MAVSFEPCVPTIEVALDCSTVAGEVAKGDVTSSSDATKEVVLCFVTVVDTVS